MKLSIYPVKTNCTAVTVVVVRQGERISNQTEKRQERIKHRVNQETKHKVMTIEGENFLVSICSETGRHEMSDSNVDETKSGDCGGQRETGATRGRDMDDGSR